MLLISLNWVSIWGREMKNRKNNLKLHEEKYRLVNAVRSKNNLFWECVYCGQPATERDHVPPITRVCDYLSLGLKNNTFIKVPSCNSCNVILSDSLQEDIFQRIEELKNHLIRKNKKHFYAKEWLEEDKKELGKNLKSFVNAKLHKEKLIKSRVEYYEGYDKLLDILLD